MSSLKKCLKAVREHLSKKEYEEALEQARLAVQEDDSSYEAHVYLGKAAFELKHVEEAKKSYKKAVEVKDDGLPAWQGLSEVYGEQGDHKQCAHAYAKLVKLTESAADSAVKAKVPLFLRKLAESSAAAGDLAAAESAWMRLTELPDLPADEKLTALCRLADVQLRQDEVELNARVAQRMTEEAAAGHLVLESVIRAAVEGEWADEALELESDHASRTLRDIISQTPPSAPFVTYHDAYLKRLRRAINAAPPGTMERHNRRMAMLQQARLMIFGKPREAQGGSCSPYAYEEALKTLEVEEEVVGAHLSYHHLAANTNISHAMPILLMDVERITSRLFHSFPWSAVAHVSQALALCRRLHKSLPAKAKTQGATTDLNANGGVRTTTRFNRRQNLVRQLLKGLKRGTRSAAGWIAVTELFLELGAVEAAMDSARQGLKYVAARHVAGRERLQQAGLSLRLLLAKALLKMQLLDEAEALFAELANWVSEGEVAFVGVVGMAPMSVRQQGIRGLAQVSMARGDVSSARQRYEEMVAMAMLGHSQQEPWAHADYGWLLYEEQELQNAKVQLEKALELLNSPARPPPNPTEKAEWQYKLGCVYWELGGEFRDDKRYAHAVLLESAAVEGLYQAPAFTLLGRYYQEVAKDEARARQCFQRALQLDPTEAVAGEALCAMLEKAGKANLACKLCQEMLSRSPSNQWAEARLATLLMNSGEVDAAISSFQKAIAKKPQDATLWENLGTAYQGSARYTSALKAYYRALELDPTRAFSRLQVASLQFQLGSFHESIQEYKEALGQDPSSLAAQLGLCEALLADARTAGRMGAVGLAAARLKEARALAQAAVKSQPNLQAARKLLGDVELQHASITPLDEMLIPSSFAASDTHSHSEEPAPLSWTQWAVQSMQARKQAVQRAALAYKHLIHLDPTQGLIWGDLSLALHQVLTISKNHPEVKDQVPVAPSTPERAAKGGLRLCPDSSGLWHCLGHVAQAPGTAEYAAVCALRLEPKSGTAWVHLGRLYAKAGSGALADKCYEEARSVEPTLIPVWEAMGELHAAEAAAGSNFGVRSMVDAWEHAVGLGGGLQSHLGYAAGAVVMGTAPAGTIQTCALKSVYQQPLAAEALNAAGLGHELRGSFPEAVSAYQAALEILEEEAKRPADERGDKISFQLAGSSSGYLEAVCLNLARVLVKSGKVVEGVELYSKLGKDGIGDNAGAWIAYGFGLYQMGMVDQCMAALSLALKLSSADTPEAPGSRWWSGAVGLLKVLLRSNRVTQAGQLVSSWSQKGRVQAYEAGQLWLVVHAGALCEKDTASTQAAAQQLRLAAVRADADKDRRGEPGTGLVAEQLLCQAAAEAGSQSIPSAILTVKRAVHLCPWEPKLREKLAELLQQSRPHATTAATLRCMQATTPTGNLDEHVAATATAASWQLPSYILSQASAILCQWSGSVTSQSREHSSLIRKLLHNFPDNPISWYLTALLSSHTACGSQAAGESSKAASWCKVALQRLQRVAPDSIPQPLLSAMKLQLLTSFSEAHLNTRPANNEMALRCAQQAVRLAATSQLPAYTANRQLARVLEAVGKRQEAVEVLEGVRGLDVACAISSARLKALIGAPHFAEQLEEVEVLCEAAIDEGDFTQDTWPSAITGSLPPSQRWQPVVATERALLLRESEDLAAAKSSLSAVHLQGPANTAHAAQLVRGAVALQQGLAAKQDGDKDGSKEALNDANYSLRQAVKLDSGSAVALLLLGRLELAKGRQAPAMKQIDKIKSCSPLPASVKAEACATASLAAASRVGAAVAVHLQPWMTTNWKQLLTTVASSW